MQRTILIALIALAVLGAGGWYLWGGNAPSSVPQAPTPAAQTPPAAPLEAQAVQAVEARVGRLFTTRSVSGRLQAATDAQVASEGGGRVTQVLRREGDRVQEGETVVVTDDTALRQQLQGAQLGLRNAQLQLEAAQRQSPEGVAQARLALVSAQSALQSAQQSHTANQRLFELQAVSQVELNQSRNAVDQAQTALRSAEDSLARASRAVREGVAQLQIQVEQARNQIAQLERQIEQTRVKAPFSGTVIEQRAEIGVTLAPGSPVFRLVDTRSLQARFSVTSADAALLPVGAQVSVQAAGQRFQAKISRSAGAPVENRLVPLQARFLPAQDTSPLAAGAVVTVRYDLRLAEGVLLPSSAIQTEAGNNFAFVVKDGKAARVRLESLAEAGGRSAVRGLPAGSRVISPVPAGLQAGNPVNVVRGGP